MKFKLFPSLTLIAFVAIGVGISSQSAFAQGDPTLPPVVQPDRPVAPTQQPTTDNQGSGTTDTSDGVGIGELDDAIDLQPTPDQRNQGFIGASADRMQETGFIGSPGISAGPGLAEGAFTGGGVNSSVQGSVNIGTARGGGGAGTENGFNVARQSVRARLVPSFYSPPRSSQQVVSRFGRHFAQQPGAAQTTGNYTISVQNRTATLNGSVGTRADSERLVRQLRLEPGVYKIVNQLQVSN